MCVTALLEYLNLALCIDCTLSKEGLQLFLFIFTAKLVNSYFTTWSFCTSLHHDHVIYNQIVKIQPPKNLMQAVKGNRK